MLKLEGMGLRLADAGAFAKMEPKEGFFGAVTNGTAQSTLIGVRVGLE